MSEEESDMCKPLPGEPWYSYLLRYVQEQPRVIMAIIGWAAAAWIYLDFKEFLTQQGALMTKIEMRLDHIERVVENKLETRTESHESDH